MSLRNLRKNAGAAITQLLIRWLIERFVGLGVVGSVAMWAVTRILGLSLGWQILLALAALPAIPASMLLVVRLRRSILAERNCPDLVLLPPVQGYQLTWDPPEILQIWSDPNLPEGHKLPLGTTLPVFGIKNLSGDVVAKGIQLHWRVRDYDAAALTAAATDNPHMARYFDGIAGHLYVFKTGEGGMMQGSFAVEAFGELPYLTASSGDQDSFVEVAVPEKVWCLVELLMLPKLCHAPIGAAGSIVILDVRVSCTEPRRCPAKDSEVQVKAKSGLLTSGSGVLGTELNVVVQPGQPEVSARVTFDVRRAGRK